MNGVKQFMFEFNDFTPIELGSVDASPKAVRRACSIAELVSKLENANDWAGWHKSLDFGVEQSVDEAHEDGPTSRLAADPRALNGAMGSASTGIALVRHNGGLHCPNPNLRRRSSHLTPARDAL